MSNKPSFKTSLTILWPYLRENFLDQVKSIWFIVAYLAFFQLFILQLPLVYVVSIVSGIAIVAFGLMFFMEGLRLGLMPLGETIGAILPRNAKLWAVLLFAFLLGIGATFAEPAIAVLRSAGAGVSPEAAPLLYSMLNDFSSQLVLVVGIGVGFAVMLGVLRFYYQWSLKWLILPGVSLLLILTLIAQNNSILQPILGLAWDCGAVTTGPVTVPLVLALGIGVCRVMGDGDTSNAGFGIVTLASLFPILAVLLLSFTHYFAKDYYGAENYQGELRESQALISHDTPDSEMISYEPISEEEYQQFVTTGVIPDNYRLRFETGNHQLIEGRINVDQNSMVIEKPVDFNQSLFASENWDSSVSIGSALSESAMTAIRAIIPLCLFLWFSLWLVMRMAGETMSLSSELGIGIIFSVIGMALFVLGITLGLTPLGSQLGSNIPITFTDLVPWGMERAAPALFTSDTLGKSIAIIFGFFLGYGATLAEPALNALGATVEKITVGAFRKALLMQSVAIGVGLGISVGVLKIAYNIPLAWLLIPPYVLLLVLTWISSEEFVNFGWDSAGVTTGPITVPLVLAMGLGIGGAVPGVTDGFGVLALASVGPIITVLLVGLIVSRTNKLETSEVSS